MIQCYTDLPKQYIEYDEDGYTVHRVLPKKDTLQNATKPPRAFEIAPDIPIPFILDSFMFVLRFTCIMRYCVPHPSKITCHSRKPFHDSSRSTLTAFVVLISVHLWHGTPSEDCAGVFLARDNESKTFENERATAGVSSALHRRTEWERKKDWERRWPDKTEKKERKARKIEMNINERMD